MSDSPIDTPAQSMKVPWDKENADYVDARDPTLIEMPDGQALPLRPDGPIRYMQSGRWKRVHVEDVLAYATAYGITMPSEQADTLAEPEAEPSPPEPTLKAVAPDIPADYEGTCNTTPTARGPNVPATTQAGLTPLQARVDRGLRMAQHVAEQDRPKPDPDDLLSAPNLLEVARRAYRCAGESQRNLGRGASKEMLYRLYIRLGDAAYAHQRDVVALKPGPLPLDIQPDLSKATNKAQDAVQFDRDELFGLSRVLNRKNEFGEGGLHARSHELWVAVSAVIAAS